MIICDLFLLVASRGAVCRDRYVWWRSVPNDVPFGVTKKRTSRSYSAGCSKWRQCGSASSGTWGKVSDASERPTRDECRDRTPGTRLWVPVVRSRTLERGPWHLKPQSDARHDVIIGSSSLYPGRVLGVNPDDNLRRSTIWCTIAERLPVLTIPPSFFHRAFPSCSSER